MQLCSRKYNPETLVFKNIKDLKLKTLNKLRKSDQPWVHKQREIERKKKHWDDQKSIRWRKENKT